MTRLANLLALLFSWYRDLHAGQAKSAACVPVGRAFILGDSQAGQNRLAAPQGSVDTRAR